MVWRKAASFGLFCIATGWTAARYEWGPTVCFGLAAALGLWAIIDHAKRNQDEYV